MVDKISSYPPASPSDAPNPAGTDTEAASPVSDALSVQEAGATSLEGIAAGVQAGDLQPRRAVELILTDALQSPMMPRLPEPLQQEIESCLRAVLDTDPHLQALCLHLGPRHLR